MSLNQKPKMSDWYPPVNSVDSDFGWSDYVGLALFIIGGLFLIWLAFIYKVPTREEVYPNIYHEVKMMHDTILDNPELADSYFVKTMELEDDFHAVNPPVRYTYAAMELKIFQ